MRSFQDNEELLLGHKEYELSNALSHAISSPLLNDEEVYNIMLEALGKSHFRDFLKTANELFNQIK